MNKEERIKEQFLKNTANHSLEIKQDNELYRHLTFTNNGSSVYRFDLHTWPGFLAITGDMGAYIFSRVEDMFDFFRREELSINSGYWAEKCQCNGTSRAMLEEWSADSFRESVLDWVKGIRDEIEEEDKRKEFDEQLKWEVLHHADDEALAIRKALDFKWEGVFPLQDFWEVEPYEYRFHFLWCLYAIVWGIQQYDEHHKEPE